ncbi:type I-E CRISPR-associated protein Cas5/CasD [Roseovarius salinarum]|uniref:type I-E CRISPR-associated protein Cas5/CasD n=1 Tax=Roseovarius salinarum TaxID=1981892 RepID=UPI000C3213E6|nr:type I-E CRISPR-associated protein Cas5/CasD [Roseovarius salinarum]
MSDYVVFSLVAPIGAFGGPAGHERRGSEAWPGRGAILGLLGAALGVRRDEADALAALGRWKMAVSALSHGPALRDFHTVQTVPAARIKRPRTRAHATAALTHRDNAMITRRDYRMDCAFGIALWDGPDPDALVTALANPVFTPYLGRKSCPLSAPMGPLRVNAENPLHALEQVKIPPFLDVDPRQPVFVASDEPLENDGYSELHWDVPIDREKWHFAARQVHVARPGPGGEGGA